MSAKYTTAAPLFAALLFALLAIAFLPYLGIQNDESLFATVIYGPIARSNRLRALGHDVPLMVMTYVGTLKTWLYSLIFLVAKPSIWSLRMPVVLIGSATVFLFGRLLHKSIGFAGMCIGLILLTVDASFLMTTTFDWGPVALQHLLMVAGLLLILRFTDTYHWAHLGGAFFCFGLAVWDKALFTWSIAGLAAATLAIFHEELIVLCKPRNVAIALLGFALGAEL